MRAKTAAVEGKAGKAVVELRGSGGRAKKKSLETEKTVTGLEVKCLKASGNPAKEEAEVAFAGTANGLSREAVFQGQGKDRGVAPPALPAPIASFNI